MRITAALAIAAGITVSAAAGPIEPDHIPADATWVAHVDLDALRNSELLGSIADVQDAFNEINGQFIDEFGIDPQATLDGVTAFGHGELGDENDLDGVILYGSAGLQQLINLIEREAPDHRRRTVGNQLVYEFEMDDDEAFASLRVNVADTRMPAGNAISPWTLQIAPSEAKRTRVANTVTERSGDNRLAKASPRGAIVYIASDRLDDIVGEHGEDNPASRFLSSAESLTIAIGEDNGNFSFLAELVTGDEQTANDVKSMADGFIAMARIAAAGEPEAQALLKLSKFLNLSVDGRAVNISLVAPIDEIADTIRTLDDGAHGNVDIRIEDSDVEVKSDIRLQRQ